MGICINVQTPRVKWVLNLIPSYLDQGTVSLKFRSSFYSTKSTSLRANSPPRSFSKEHPGTYLILLRQFALMHHSTALLQCFHYYLV